MAKNVNARKKGTASKAVPSSTPRSGAAIGDASSHMDPEPLARLEFFRHAVALMPSVQDHFPAVAKAVPGGRGRVGNRFCSCKASRKKTCDHLKTLERTWRVFLKQRGADDAATAFARSRWHTLAKVLADGRAVALATVVPMTNAPDPRQADLVMVDAAGDPLLIYHSTGPDRNRWMERIRCGSSGGGVPTRADVLQELALMTMTDDEAILRDRGMKTVRQAFEESLWCRFAYHCFMEFADNGVVLTPAIDDASGEFMLLAHAPDGRPVFRLPVPRKKVKQVLTELAHVLTNQHGLRIAPLSLDSIFDVSLNEGLDLEIQPLLRLIRENGESRFFKRKDLARYQYGDLYYINELGILVEDQYPKRPPPFTEALPTVVQRSRVPMFLAEHAPALKENLFRLDAQVQQLRIMDRFDRIGIAPEAMERDWCWLSVTYGDGNQSISLAEILRAKQTDRRFATTSNGWVDCSAPAFDFLNTLATRVTPDADAQAADDRVRLSRAEVLRIAAAADTEVQPVNGGSAAEALRRLLSLEPLAPMPKLKGLRSHLRDYQQRGVDWLRFLHENRLGGLLCDDMGLGKTHQVMALLVDLRENGGSREPFLVVCPTSVISHWEQKLQQYAPGLTVAIHHGGQRDLDGAVAAADVIITSYGILRRDIDQLQRMAFDVAVFDEMQQIKNVDTLSHKAAQTIDAGIKIGVTGTPLENRLEELKALMDIVLPGYLGSDESFDTIDPAPIEQHRDTARQQALRRLIYPFTLRRLKKSVLHELPEKIEDVRTCRLSEDQVKLYRDAVEQRGREFLGVLNDDGAALPYIHIFALLNLLKQICNHPALVKKDPDGYGRYRSGKWDLFTDLLDACLDSGQKVVIYSQYLIMIDIISRHLTERRIDHVALTGASCNRGRIIRRFDEDPNCRVFVGSLKAGGVGIDLVAASVVIHYDRWWNAAREDQATDRVHRIGQTRGVQVFKLVTEGTLEEKIAAIIDRKRDLMDSLLPEDDPHLVKIFSRQELIDMLAPPG